MMNITDTNSQVDAIVSTDNILPAAEALRNRRQHLQKCYRDCQRLHLKTQRIVSFWNQAVEDGGAVGSGGLGICRQKIQAAWQGCLGTLVYAGVAALYVAVIQFAAVTNPVIIRLSIWLGIGGYGAFFYQWTKQSYKRLLCPLWIGFAATWISMSAAGYLFLCMGLLVWIRSGHCCEYSGFPKAIVFDFFLSYGGLAMAFWLVESTTVTIVWATLMFTSLQGLFFHSSHPFGP